MYLQACALLFTAGLWLNRSDRRMLALTVLVAASVFLPVPRDSAEQFYLFCIAAETVVALVALALIRARGSELIASLCIVLIVVHVMGYIMDGYPRLSGYRILVPILESLQLVACLCMSPAIYPRLRNRLP